MFKLIKNILFVGLFIFYPLFSMDQIEKQMQKIVLINKACPHSDASRIIKNFFYKKVIKPIANERLVWFDKTHLKAHDIAFLSEKKLNDLEVIYTINQSLPKQEFPVITQKKLMQVRSVEKHLRDKILGKKEVQVKVEISSPYLPSDDQWSSMMWSGLFGGAVTAGIGLLYVTQQEHNYVPTNELIVPGLGICAAGCLLGAGVTYAANFSRNHEIERYNIRTI